MELLEKQLEGMLPEPVPSNTSTKKKSKTGKRALMMIIVLTMMAIIHTIIQRLSDTHINALFGQLFSKMSKLQNDTIVN
jgi:hypothetical protein